MDLSEALKLAEVNFPRGPETVADRLGISVYHDPFGGADGFYLRRGNVVTIQVNSSVPKNRQRFTLAHELAHILLGASPRRTEKREPFASDQPEEQASDRLAAELLLPKSKIVVPGLPFTHKLISQTARRAEISEVVVACRIANLAQELGLINAAVIAFAGDEPQWVWSPTLTVPVAVAIDLFKKTKQDGKPLSRTIKDDQEVVTSFLLGHPEYPVMMLQLLPQAIASNKTIHEQIAELENWLFGDDTHFRGSVNGCLSIFKSKAQNMNLSEAIGAFSDKYLHKWTGSNGAKIRDHRGQQYLKLRLGEWVKK